MQKCFYEYNLRKININIYFLKLGLFWAHICSTYFVCSLVIAVIRNMMLIVNIKFGTKPRKIFMIISAKTIHNRKICTESCIVLPTFFSAIFLIICSYTHLDTVEKRFLLIYKQYSIYLFYIISHSIKLNWLMYKKVIVYQTLELNLC